MKQEIFLFEGCGGAKLSAVIWTPDDEPRMTLQIAHGMTEHMGRYEKLAEALTARGIAVAGFDLRGHGKNPGDPKVASFGEGGWVKSMEDMHLFHEELRRRFPHVPHFMLGFSLGSFLLREYLSLYPDGISGAIVMGTGNQPGWVLSIMAAIVGTQVKKAGFDGTTPLVQKLSFDTYNQKFSPTRTRSDWLCADQSQLDLYLRDELCRENISAGLFREMLCAMKRTGGGSAYEKWPKDMPLLLISGADDPVGDAGKGVQRVEVAMRKAGMKSVQMKLYPGARHDLLHEEASGNAEAARSLIAEWLIEHNN